MRYLNIFGHCHREFPPIGWPACPIQLVWLFSCSSDSDRTVLDQGTHGTLLIKDVTFKSASTAANFVTGTSTNGLKVWKDKKGTTLKELISSEEVKDE